MSKSSKASPAPSPSLDAAAILASYESGDGLGPTARAGRLFALSPAAAGWPDPLDASIGIRDDRTERRNRITHFLNEWHIVADTTAGDMFDAEREIGNIQRLRTAFATPQSIEQLSYDELFDALIGCHAFYDRLRFVSGGLPGLRAQFSAQNSIIAIKGSLTFLLHGPGTALERAYDCLYDERRWLSGFGEACIMEFLGWMNTARPPINGRTIKALRFLGFDVKD